MEYLITGICKLTIARSVEGEGISAASSLTQTRWSSSFAQIAAVLLISVVALFGASVASAAPNIAVVYADMPNFAADVVNKLTATGRFSSVTIIDAGAVTPTLQTLNNYDAVLVYSDAGFSDRVTLGDNLHAYVSSGHTVVDCVFNNAGSGPTGLFSANADYAFTPMVGFRSGGVTLGVIAQPSSPLVTGVTSLDSGSYRGSGALSSGAQLIASWSDGIGLVAVKTVGTGAVVGLNLFPPSSDARGDFWLASTDGTRLMANALMYQWVSPTPVPTLSQWSLITLGLLLGGFALIQFRRSRPKPA